MYGVLMGLSPVNSRASYRKPPKVQPKNGATIGTCVAWSQKTLWRGGVGCDAMLTQK